MKKKIFFDGNQNIDEFELSNIITFLQDFLISFDFYNTNHVFKTNNIWFPEDLNQFIKKTINLNNNINNNISLSKLLISYNIQEKKEAFSKLFYAVRIKKNKNFFSIEKLYIVKKINYHEKKEILSYFKLYKKTYKIIKKIFNNYMNNYSL